MNGYQTALLGVVFCITVFYFIAQKWGGRPSNIREFFHDPHIPRNAFSLTAANLGIGQGLALIIAATQPYGILFLMVPLMVFAGQKAYSYFVTRIAPGHLFEKGMLVVGLSDAIDREAGRPIYFQQWTVGFVIMAYMMALAYEVLISSQWLCLMLFPSYGVIEQAFVSVLILIVAISYTVSGGYRTIQRTDFAQVICGILLILGLVFLMVFGNLPPGLSTTATLVPTGIFTFLGFCTLALAPFNAQFYGILNQAAASHQVASEDRKRLFNISSALTLGLFIALALGSLYFNLSKGGALESLQKFVGAAAQSPDVSTKIMVGLSAVGVTAIIMSTADTLMIVITQTLYEGFSGRGEIITRSSHDAGSPQDLQRVRTAVLLVFPAAFAFLVPLWFLKPDAFGLLFAIAAPCEVVAPLIALLILLARDGKLSVVTNVLWGRVAVLHIYFVLSGVALVVAILANMARWPMAKSVGTIAFICSLMLSLILWFKAKKLP